MTASAERSPDAMPLWALLPVKDFGRAKSRLSSILDAAARAALARRFYQHVLQTLRSCAELDGVLVLSDSEEVLRLAEEQRFCGEPECKLENLPASWPLGAIVDDGLMRLQRRGARAALVLMSDLPLVGAAELLRLIALLREHDLVIAPDLREQNTNALALRLGDTPSTAFGSGDSFRRHVELAARAGQRAAVYRARGLGFDVDLPADYAELLASEGVR